MKSKFHFENVTKFKKQNKIQDVLNVNQNFIASSVKSPKAMKNNLKKNCEKPEYYI